MANEDIVNKVAKSALISIDLEEMYDPGERVVFDLKNHLYQELVLREKDFRDFIKVQDWSEFQGKNVAISCSVDAIIPTWAYMLLTAKLEPYANTIVLGDLDDLEKELFKNALNDLNIEDYRDQKIVVKGCSDKPVPDYAYVELTRKLRPVVSSLMFGEPCSTVPVYKKPKEKHGS